MTLAAVVRNIRAERGLSLSQLAAIAGVTKTHLWDLEQGRSENPTLSTLRGLARAAGISLTALVTQLETRP